ncbi:L-lactate permease [Corynebacterium hadale]|uniref:L-lactate permease n=2 Tax=Corynebacterium TaxID=1716 RepID=A0ABX4HBK7_9CORY|nr:MULTISPECIES: L-lactate permease [Corynebacterium]MCG7255306.1 L-lactate permease [Corynebacterium hadale]MCG7257614.1 L-lactate permease [Corynebacterium hadale]MCG7264537.1 L-lactate permease [Corynebacterium hadale]PAT06817.1 L-lactate permease [Corynebacterium hadale]PAT08927.1 L-lactate permease [Corynebacterium hadale]
MDQFQVFTDAVGGSVGLSALVSAIPLLTFFIMLLGVKASAHLSGLVALVAALLVAIFGFNMPAGMAISSAFRGGLFGLLPIVFVIMAAIWFYQITVASGRFEDLRLVFDKMGHGDVRIQAMLIAFCFGGLLEALAGFGAPVAITATMILALGIKPLRAATIVLIANTAPVAFGAVAIPITTAGEVGGRTLEQTENIAAIVGHQTPFLAFFVPFIIAGIIDGMRGVRETAPAALVIGLSFGIAQWFTSNFFAYQLTDVVACIVALGAAFLLLRFWQPKGIADMRERLELPRSENPDEVELPGNRIWMALMPYAVVVVIFGLANLGSTIPEWLSSFKVTFPWPGLPQGSLLDANGADVKADYSFAYLNNPGTLLVISGLIVALAYIMFNENGRYSLTWGQVGKELTDTMYRMRWSAATIVLVLALAYVMNYSGQTVTIGEFFANLGGFFAFAAPILGWVGVAVTGSDTSANALFAKLQVTAADQLNLNPDLMLAANTTGGVVGKMVSPQSLAIAATAVDMEGKESEIFKKVVGYSFIFLLAVCVMVFLQTNILSFLAPAV